MKQWVNTERTVMVVEYAHNEQEDTLQVATRPEPGAIWGPPIIVKREHIHG